jgi:hypothetical protein
VLDAKGLLHEKPVSGRVVTRAGSLAARYELALDDGWRLTGERRARLTDPLYSSSTLRAKLVDPDGNERAELVLRLDYRRDLWRFLPT